MKEIFKLAEKAEQYRTGALGKNGDAKRMLIVQHAFPNKYAYIDTMLKRKENEQGMENNVQTMRCLLDHTLHGPSMLKTWLLSVTELEIFRFLIDLFDADPDINWTGYRIMASIIREHRMWIFELFSKHQKSNTVVYSGYIAPNIVKKLYCIDDY